jgi:hypothetical protein
MFLQDDGIDSLSEMDRFPTLTAEGFLMLRRTSVLFVALGLVTATVAGCSSAPDRQAAIPWDISVQSSTGKATEATACGDYSEEISCILGGTETHTTVLNGSSVLFGGLAPHPARSVQITKVCWSPAGEVEPVDCDSDGKVITPGLVSQTTISGFPAISFAAEKIADLSPDAPADGVYPLPAAIYLRVDGREVVVEIACCTTL